MPLPHAIAALAAALSLLFALFVTESYQRPLLRFDASKSAIVPNVVRAGDTVSFHKYVEWDRLCPAVSEQDFVSATLILPDALAPHQIVVPPQVGVFEGDRKMVIPKTLTPGKWRYRIRPRGSCWPWERLFPIGGMTMELPFTVVE